MTKSKTAIILTLLWIILGIVIVVAKIDSIKGMPLNEIGDFLAGFFSPVAFLWLVFGYFQQGEELKLNTRALELQVGELKLSVEQQRELVEVTRADMALTKQAYELEIKREQRKAQPTLQLQVESYNSGTTGVVSLNATLSNHGHSATELRLNCSKGTITPREVGVIPAGNSRAINVDFASSPSWDFTVEIDYLDGLEQSKRQIFSAIRNEYGHLIFLPPKETLPTDV